MESLKKSVDEIKPAWESLKNKTSEFSCAVCMAILARELSNDEAWVKNSIGQLMEQVAGEKLLKLELNAEDFNLLKEKHASFLDEIAPSREIEIKAEKENGRGTCKITTAKYIFETNPYKQLEWIQKELNSHA